MNFNIKKVVKKIIGKSSVYSFKARSRKRNITEENWISNEQIIETWKSSGRPVPPPQIYKRSVILDFAKKHSISTFIETGTYQGETLNDMKNKFKKLFSVELDEKLFDEASLKFKADKNIILYKGDSGELIGTILNNIDVPCLFWLDGHYSEGFTAKGKLNTPILAELTHILNHALDEHVILIDDARCFNGEDDYPTLPYLENFVKQKNPELKFSVEDDIIRIHK